MSSGVTRRHGPRARPCRHGLGAAVALLAVAVLSACGDDGAMGPGFMVPDMDAADRPMDAGSDAAREEDARVVVPPPAHDAGSDARVATDTGTPPDPDDDADVPDCGDLDCPALSDGCNLGVCDPETVTCHLEPRADGTFCGSTATEDCSARDTCQQGACVPNDAPAGTPCDDQNVDCRRNDECDGHGQCVDNGLMPEDTPCGDATNNDCNDPDTCDDEGVCQPNYAPVDSLCGDVGVLCRYDDRCDGQGECVDSGIWMLEQCPTNQVTKDGQDYCLCGRNARDTCHPGPDVCIDGTCRPGHEQFAPDGITTDGTPCGNGDPIDAECDNPDECQDGQCEQNGKPAGMPCGNQTVSNPICDQRDVCDGFGSCDPRWAPMTTACGDQPGECWQEPLCDGLGGCAPAEPASPVTSCGSPLDNDCTDPDTCDGAGGCNPNDTSC